MRKIIAASALAGALLAGPATAFATVPDPDPVAVDDDDDDDSDKTGLWGLLGLLGLAGLAGLKRRDNHVEYRPTTTSRTPTPPHTP